MISKLPYDWTVVVLGEDDDAKSLKILRTRGYEQKWEASNVAAELYSESGFYGYDDEPESDEEEEELPEQIRALVVLANTANGVSVHYTFGEWDFIRRFVKNREQMLIDHFGKDLLDRIDPINQLFKK